MERVHRRRGHGTLGYGWLERVHPDDRDRVRDAWRVAIRAGTRFDLEFRLQSTDGSYRWFKGRSVAIRNTEGTILKWYGANTDVDDLKRVEELRQQNLDRFEGVLNALSEGLLTVDEGLVITFFNRAAERIFGADEGGLDGRKLIDVFPDVGGSTFEKKLARAFRDKAPTSFEVELRLVASAGRYRVRTYPLEHPEGMSVFLERLAGRTAK